MNDDTQPKLQKPAKRGRPRTLRDDAVRVNVYMTAAHRDKLAALGGAAWVRRQIERAKLPAATAPH